MTAQWISHCCDECGKTWRMRVTERPTTYLCPECRPTLVLGTDGKLSASPQLTDRFS